MVTAGGRFIVLVVLMTTEILSVPPPSVGVQRKDRAHVVAGLIDNLASRLTRLEDNISGGLVSSLVDKVAKLEANEAGRRNEANEKRCETGFVHFTPHARPNLPVSDGTVRRTDSVHVSFSRPFATKPWVSVAITRLDVYNNANLRVDVGADTISTSGFNAFAYEWLDTNIVLVRISWVACNI